MRRKFEDEEAEKDSSERWLLTYSDMITLLLAFFIILYTISNIDLVKFKALSQSLHAAFNGTTTSATGGGAGNGTGGGGAGAGASSGDSSSGGDSAAGTDSGNGLLPASNPLNEVYQELSRYIEANNLQNQIDLESTDTYVMVRLKDMVLFVPDQTTMIKSSEPILGEIEKALAGVYDKIDNITISGHTADPNNDGEKSSVFEWQLSTGRAVNVLTYMVGLGLPQPKLSIGGYSHYKPIADNNTTSGSAQNRRVEIRVSKNTASSTPTAGAPQTPSAATSSASTSAQ